MRSSLFENTKRAATHKAFHSDVYDREGLVSTSPTDWDSEKRRWCQLKLVALERRTVSVEEPAGEGERHHHLNGRNHVQHANSKHERTGRISGSAGFRALCWHAAQMMTGLTISHRPLDVYRLDSRSAIAKSFSRYQYPPTLREAADEPQHPHLYHI